MEADLARAREARAAAEAAVERAEANDQARQSTIEGLRKQLREVKNLNLRTLGNLQELQDKLKEEKEKVHSLSQLRDRLQSEQQSLQHKLKEAASAQERLQG